MQMGPPHPTRATQPSVRRRRKLACLRATLSREGRGRANPSDSLKPYPVTPPILPAAITACVRLSTPSFVRIAETCAFTVASETDSS